MNHRHLFDALVNTSTAGRPYAASKGGMEIFKKTIALELVDREISVNRIAPGAIATDMNKDMLEDW